MSSLEMIGQVWLSALPKGVSKIVLLCFCAHLNDAAALSWPSVARVARLCGMGERTVQNHIRALERAGILVARLRRTGRATRYAVALDGLQPLPCAAPAWQVLPCAPDAIAAAPTPAEFAPSPADFDGPPPQLFTPTPAESAPITVLNLKENIKTPGAPALPAARVRFDQVNPQVMADFAAVRATKRKGPVTATVVQDLCEQAALAGITLEQAMKTCCMRNWARFEAGWLQPLPGAGAGAGGAGVAGVAAVAAPALYVPPPTLPAAPGVAAAGRERLATLRQATVDAGLGSAKGCGWAHAAIEKHRAGQPVRHAVLLDACAALKLKPSSLYAAGLH